MRGFKFSPKLRTFQHTRFGVLPIACMSFKSYTCYVLQSSHEITGARFYLLILACCFFIILALWVGVQSSVTQRHDRFKAIFRTSHIQYARFWEISKPRMAPQASVVTTWKHKSKSMYSTTHRVGVQYNLFKTMSLHIPFGWYENKIWIKLSIKHLQSKAIASDRVILAQDVGWWLVTSVYSSSQSIFKRPQLRSFRFYIILVQGLNTHGKCVKLLSIICSKTHKIRNIAFAY